MQHAKPISGVLRPERLPKFGMPPNSQPPVSSSCIFRTIWIGLYFGFPTSLRRLFEEANAIFASSKGM